MSIQLVIWELEKNWEKSMPILLERNEAVDIGEDLCRCLLYYLLRERVNKRNKKGHRKKYNIVEVRYERIKTYMYIDGTWPFPAVSISDWENWYCLVGGRNDIIEIYSKKDLKTETAAKIIVWLRWKITVVQLKLIKIRIVVFNVKVISFFFNSNWARCCRYTNACQFNYILDQIEW